MEFDPTNISSPRAAACFYQEDSAARRQAKSTIKGREYDLEVFLKFCDSKGVFDLNKVDQNLLESYRRFLNQYRKVNGDELTIGTIRNRLTTVTTMLARLHRLKVISENPAYQFDLPQLPKAHPTGFFTENDIGSIIGVTRAYGMIGFRDRAMIETLYATGVRRTELANLDVKDIDFEKELVSVRKGKGNKDRRVPIAPIACMILRRYLKDIRPKIANAYSGTSLFLTNKGKRYVGGQLTYMAKRYMKKANIDRKGSCSIFRHTAATMMLENGADIRHVQEFLGHASISTTQIYTHVTVIQLRKVYAKTHPMALQEGANPETALH